jgi:GMP synthase (glutamine-hydrolysing)
VEILVLQHDGDSGLDSLEEPLADAGLRFEVWESHRKEAPDRPVAGYDGLIVLGGIANPDEDAEHAWLATERTLMQEALSRELPVLGVCLGGQLLAQVSGGTAGPAPGGPEIGWHTVRATPEQATDELFGGLPEQFRAFEWHGYCFEPPPTATLLYNNARFNQAFRFGKNAWGTQFHFEAAPDTIRDWFATARDEALAYGVDIDEVERGTQAYGAAQVSLCHTVAARFAAVVRRYAGSR